MAEMVRRGLPGLRRHAADLLAVLLLGLMAVSLLSIAVEGRPMSSVDEPTHYDNAIRVERGEYPHRGSVYTMAMVDEWACGVGHETGRLLIPCGDPTLSPDVLPMTRLTTGYIHYPTYFVQVVAVSEALDAAFDGLPRIDRLRAASTLLLLGGVVGCWLLARSSGLTGARRLAVTFAPVAAPGILTYGPMVNPGAAAVLCGALVAWTGLRWARTGRGFWWYLAAAAYASLTAATSSLPVAVLLLASGVAWLGLLVGVPAFATWRVRWWQLALQAAVFLGPVVVWGQYIEARATVPNEVVYAVVAVTSHARLVAGAFQELLSLHNPWGDVGALPAAEGDLVGLFLRSPAYGLPGLLSLLVLGALGLRLLGEWREHRATADDVEQPALEPAGTGRRAQGVWSGRTDRVAARWPDWLTGDRLLVAALLLVFFCFPPALRLSNALSFGIDFPIVQRYLISLTPLAVVLAVRSVRGDAVPRVLAGMSMVTVVAVCLTAW